MIGKLETTPFRHGAHQPAALPTADNQARIGHQHSVIPRPADIGDEWPE